MQPFVLHAHFYQPERLNPWTGALDPEPSASPDRDWNERIHRECYRPNAVARIFDDQRRVERLINNYEYLSFNFGPTLLGWLERCEPESYTKIVDADWRSTARRGHGNALAQAYNHMILPLANERDQRTQVLWGLADFRHRFNRDAEGMWLPETAADPDVLDGLIDAGVRFTVLAPHQAARVRPRGEGWSDATNIDTGRAYRHHHSDGSGRSLAIFFYDGALAQSLAFDPATADAAVLVERLRAAAPTEGLVHAALDGETFGHHHAFGELGLAYAIGEQAYREGLAATNYGAWLAEHPPCDDVEIVAGEATAWSCAHGVGRWYRDCGCVTDSRAGWDQAWRTPLRAALDVLRDAGAVLFEERGAALLRDVWHARDEYVRVRLGAVSRADFLDLHARRHLSEAEQVTVWTLLEAQRNAMVMYTSCGWFFADVSGLETVYVLRYAARVIGLLEALGSPPLREPVLEILAEARSNRREVGSGADVWRDQVETAEVRPPRLAAHLTLLSSVGQQPAKVETAGHDIALAQRRSDDHGRVALTTLRASMTSLATGRVSDFAVAVIHLGGLDFHGVVAPYPGDDAFAAATARLWSAFPTAPLARLLRLLAEVLDGQEFTLDAALADGRQRIVGAVFGELTSLFHEQYARLYRDHRRVLEMLVEAGYELPRDLRAAAELTLAAELDRQVAAVRELGSDAGPGAFDAVKETLALAHAQGYVLDQEPVEQALVDAVAASARTASASLHPADVKLLRGWLHMCGQLEIDLDLARAQEHAYEVALKARAGRLSQAESEVVADLGTALALSPVAWTP